MHQNNNNTDNNSNKGIYSHRFAFLGSGNMGNALINGFIDSGIVKPDEIIVYDIDSSKYNSYIMSGVHIAEGTASAIRGAEYAIIALKPTVVGSSMTEISKDKTSFEGTTFISIAAGVPIDFICEKLGQEVPVIRTMPSTPMLIGKGAIAISRNKIVEDKKFEFICDLFSRLAVVSVMEESSLNNIIGVNGSSPAYVYLFVKAMLDGAIEQGITKEQALPLILKTIEGAVGMVRQSDVGIEELINRVACAGGTTLASLNSFYKDDFEGAVKRAMAACTRRANEISAELRS
ncbi:MAG: pyrroline-5-carboxylate reductase [Clostridiales bacterium GWF2_36_10]|nr:MAG: pyrroline-5-carboxylate reductase [Clostridiales bacterium GWF2_36_10]HAN21055.1 pyrroline-5-carboxylate reductase [Clostridiales bacterium]